jgi:hypothetical protein
MQFIWTVHVTDKSQIPVDFASLALYNKRENDFKQYKDLDLQKSARQILCLDLCIFATQQ